MSISQAEFGWPGGDRPGSLDFSYPLPQEFTHRLAQLVNESHEGLFSSLEGIYGFQPSTGPAGRFKVKTTEREWFLRVCARPTDFSLVKEITGFLRENEVGVNESVVGGKVFYHEGIQYYIDVRPFLHARHFNGSEGDLIGLVSTLSRCHEALSKFSGSKKVYLNTVARTGKYEEVVCLLKKGIERGKDHLFHEYRDVVNRRKQWFFRWLDEFDPRMEEWTGSQCIHGEIHQANVMYGAENGETILIDFEESPHSYFPVTWDLTYLFQRFCLYDNPEKEILNKRYELIQTHYGKRIVKMASMMRQVAWMAVANIFHQRVSQNIFTPLEELEKFFRLYDQADRYSDY